MTNQGYGKQEKFPEPPIFEISGSSFRQIPAATCLPCLLRPRLPPRPHPTRSTTISRRRPPTTPRPCRPPRSRPPTSRPRRPPPRPPNTTRPRHSTTPCPPTPPKEIQNTIRETLGSCKNNIFTEV